MFQVHIWTSCKPLTSNANVKVCCESWATCIIYRFILKWVSVTCSSLLHDRKSQPDCLHLFSATVDQPVFGSVHLVLHDGEAASLLLKVFVRSDVELALILDVLFRYLCSINSINSWTVVKDDCSTFSKPFSIPWNCLCVVCNWL